MRRSIILFVFLLCLSCKKQDIRTSYNGNLTIKTIYKNGEVSSTKIYEKGHIDTEYSYQDKALIKIVQYYSQGKVHYLSKLIKRPNHYYTEEYNQNGTLSGEGEGDFMKTKKKYLRRGGWIFYNNEKEPSSILEFSNDSVREYLMQQTIFDTKNKKILKDTKYNPPLMLP